MEAILLTQIYFSNMIRVIEEAILRNCLKDEVHLTSESMCSEIGLLTGGIIYHNVVSIARLCE